MGNEFKRYQHIERFGTTEVDKIDKGMCYIFPKIDGTNSQLWNDKGVVCGGSRNRQLSIDNDNAGFLAWALQQQNIIDFFKEFPNLRLYGEWLVPHSLKTYQETAWRKFYVFDVMDGDDYIQYELYKKILDDYNIEYIPPICKIENPTDERLFAMLDKNDYLIKDGNGIGEGVVIKNYGYVNKYGRQTWAKIVTSEFKVKHKKVMGITELKEKTFVEQRIVNKFITSALVEKEYAKIVNEVEWQTKLIPRLLNTVFYCLVVEESWNIVKDFNFPVIDFKRLQGMTNKKIKELKPDLF